MSTPDAAASITVAEPFPIFQLAHRYLIYDIETATYIRRVYNIPGHPIGTLPQASQQNLFLGLPLELMPEEARLLVTKGVAYIVDDASEHQRTFLNDGKGGGLSVEERRAFQAGLRKQGLAVANDVSKHAADRQKAALQQKKATTGAAGATDNWNDLPEDMYTPGPRRLKAKKTARAIPGAAPTSSNRGSDIASEQAEPEEEDEELFASPSNSFPISSVRSPNPSAEERLALLRHDADRLSHPHDESAPYAAQQNLTPYFITPTTSHPPLQPSPTSFHAPLASNPIPYAPPEKFALYEHLHSRGYFLLPGLRFGCDFSAYPGDTLRFHSHFLCKGLGWEEEFDLRDIVGAGRLATGVKKGLVLGGVEEVSGDDREQRLERKRRRMELNRRLLEDRVSEVAADQLDDSVNDDGVRTFTIEWSGM